MGGRPEGERRRAEGEDRGVKRGLGGKNGNLAKRRSRVK